MPKRAVWLSLLVAVPLTILGVLTLPQPVEAQCGSSASSCKNCHEVQRQAPVNQNGVWHTSHAFGDFCEFCHGGNVKGKDQAAAHTGVSLEVVDVKGSCVSCHPDDYMARADTFAAVLGKPLGSGGTNAGATTGTSSTQNATGTEAVDPCAAAAPAGGATIDLAKVYTDSLLPAQGNLGNTILLGLVLAMAGTFGGLFWHYERPLPRAIGAVRRLLATPVEDAAADGDAGVVAVLAERPDLAALLAKLEASDRDTVRALSHLLADAENGPKVIKAVSNLDFDTLAKIGEGDRRALSALLALANELKS